MSLFRPWFLRIFKFGCVPIFFLNRLDGVLFLVAVFNRVGRTLRLVLPSSFLAFVLLHLGCFLYLSSLLLVPISSALFCWKLCWLYLPQTLHFLFLLVRPEDAPLHSYVLWMLVIRGLLDEFVSFFPRRYTIVSTLLRNLNVTLVESVPLLADCDIHIDLLR